MKPNGCQVKEKLICVFFKMMMVYFDYMLNRKNDTFIFVDRNINVACMVTCDRSRT